MSDITDRLKRARVEERKRLLAFENANEEVSIAAAALEAENAMLRIRIEMALNDLRTSREGERDLSAVIEKARNVLLGAT